MKKLFIYLLIGIFSLASCLYFGCQRYESPKDTGLNRSYKEGYRKPFLNKEEPDILGTDPQTDILGIDPQENESETVRKRKVANAEACQKRFQSCVDNCDDMACQGVCLKSLSECERHLPKELQTLKEP